MPDTLRDLVVSLSLQSDNFTRNLRSVNAQIREAESFFRLASTGVEGFETSTAGLATKLESLNQKLNLQRTAVEQYERALTAANNKLTETFNRYNEYNQRLQESRQHHQELQDCLQYNKEALEKVGEALGTDSDYYKELAADIDAFEQEVNASGQEVDRLAGQTEALRKSTQNAADAVSTAQTQLNKAKAAVKETEAQITSANKALKTSESAWKALGTACEAAGKRLEAAGRNATSVGRVLSTAVTTPIVGLGTAAVKASIDFESSFASVRKTVDATEEEFAMLAQQSKEMSTQVAASTSTINEVMATGGQLGIANEHLQEFTKVMIDLGNSCEDLSADEAATSIAKFANVMHTDQSLFQNIGSTIVDLGNNFATTEQPIMVMAQRLAGAGKQVGLTEAQVLGFATALSSVGIEAQMGGSAFSKALIKMEVAAETGGDALEDFAKVSGMTGEQFKKLFKEDAAAAFQAFIVGLSKLDEEGESAIAVLDEIGIKEVRLRDTMLRSVNATELFARAQARATQAWQENSALTIEANKRYATTASQLTNLKNKAMLFAQQIGNDLNPTIQKLMKGASDLIEKFAGMDEAQRMTLIKWAAIAAAIGPVVLAYGKFATGLGKVVSGLGTFATAVASAGGGLTGFMSVIAKSPTLWFALAAGVIAGTVALWDYVSGAKMAREATQAMIDTADEWKRTAADTFYNANNGGLSFFGMSEDDFKSNKTATSAKAWMTSLIDVWTDGKNETNEIVEEWTSSWKSLTDNTRTELQKLQEAAKESGHGGVSDQIQKDIDSLDDMDKEIESLLKKRQNGYLTDEEKVHLQELIDTRDAIIVKYKLEPDNETAGYSTILEGIEKAQARAKALGKQDADVEVYQQAVVATAQGYAVINDELDAQYDKEYAVIQLIEDEAQRKDAQAKLDEQYSADRLAAAREYASTLSQVIGPAWESEKIQDTKKNLDELSSALSAYDFAVGNYGDDSKEAAVALDRVSKVTKNLDEGDLTDYAAMLTQVSELLRSGMSEEEVSSLFPDIDVSSALDQLAAIQEFVNTYDSLEGIAGMFGEGLAGEVMEIATKLNMEGAKADWDAFAADPGQITTDATIKAINAQESVKEMMLTGRIDKVLKQSGVTLTVDTNGNVTKIDWDRRTTFVTDVFGNITDAKAPDGTVFHLNAHGDIIGATASDDTTFTVDGGTGTITNVVLGKNVTMPTILGKLSVSGYDTIALNNFTKTNPVTVTGIVRLGSMVENPEDILGQEGVKYFDEKGIEIPVALVPKEKLTAETIIAYDTDGTLHVMLTPEITGSQEAIEELQEAVTDDGKTFIGKGIINMPDLDVFSRIESAMGRIEKYKNSSGFWGWFTGEGDKGTLNTSLKNDFSGTRVAELSTYVAELVTAINNGGQVSEENIGHLQSVVDFLNELSETEVGDNILQGFVDTFNAADMDVDATNIADTIGTAISSAFENGQVGQDAADGIGVGLENADFNGPAAAVANSIEGDVRDALGSHSPAQRMVPVGEDAAAGVGEGMQSYNFSGAGGTVATNIRSSLAATLNSTTLRGIGTNIMSGLVAGINAGRSGVVSAIRRAAQDAIRAAKAELEIKSPSRVFRDEVGAMVMRGFGEGIQEETATQARIIRNAARYLTGEAMGAVSYNTNDNSKVYNDESSVNLTGNTFYIRDEQDVRSLAIEIASLTKRQKRGRGVR